MQIDIYENVFIGNFIYTLGIQVGRILCQDKEQLPACINLLQQTPADRPLGDLFASFPGVSFLIEFKRESNKSLKEQKKLKILRNEIRNKGEMTKISKSAHWFLQMKTPNSQEFQTVAVPYLEMDKIDTYLDEKHTFDSFIEKIVEQIFNFRETSGEINVGVSEVEMSAYLKFLGQIYRKSGVKSGGLVMTVSPDGGFTYIVTNDITQMLEKHKTIVRKHQLELSRSSQLSYGGIER
ncbi:hypothetical protein [Sporomusa sphaeroides]|uniref:Uncharacterized protein n=1 Tax=Sporomusa sphaeroides DSM 2875 TaxID=1337886 RepID=A0ABM9WAD1_9FIRM|nr:hypothetical protein [Sporomusa sphaeroides]OLS54445.1 hypothetical protein SPSPH_45270 [Sporomusa sphaeroides DSM 2875]CVK21862.1 hypothetical protein SSPH_04580 [Sporomusa sphaeroides DSM 2875]